MREAAASASAQVATRMFGYPSAVDNDTMHAVLLPVLDMANCADKGAVCTSPQVCSGTQQSSQLGMLRQQIPVHNDGTCKLNSGLAGPLICMFTHMHLCSMLCLGAATGLAGPSDLGANGEVRYPEHGENSFAMVALRDISKGEEVITHHLPHGATLLRLVHGYDAAP